MSSTFFSIQVNETWKQLYREHFLKQALANVQECRNAFYRRDLVKNEVIDPWCFDSSDFSCPVFFAGCGRRVLHIVKPKRKLYQIY